MSRRPTGRRSLVIKRPGNDSGLPIREPRSTTTSLLHPFMRMIPRIYFKPSKEDKVPVAPVSLVVMGSSFDVVAALVAFAVMVWYFATAPTLVTTISSKLLPGQKCSVLNPKSGTVYFSSANSENAQFAKPTNLTSQQCIAMLTKLDVCGDGQRLDVINLWGVTNPNNSRYFPGGSGYYSFTPTQSVGLKTQLAAFYGSTVSFPKPVFGGQSFTGPNTNWNLLNLASSATPPSALTRAFARYPGVVASGLLFDSSTNKVYNPDSISTQQDYNLSTAVPNTDSKDIVGKMGTYLRSNVVSLGVNRGVYYGLRVGTSFINPIAVAVDEHLNVFVAESHRVCRIVGVRVRVRVRVC